MRKAFIHLYEKATGKSHPLTKEFGEIQELINYIDNHCAEQNMEVVDVTVECEGLTESDIEELTSVWIQVIAN